MPDLLHISRLSSPHSALLVQEASTTWPMKSVGPVDMLDPIEDNLFIPRQV